MDAHRPLSDRFWRVFGRDVRSLTCTCSRLCDHLHLHAVLSAPQPSELANVSVYAFSNLSSLVLPVDGFMCPTLSRLDHLDAWHMGRLASHVLQRFKASESWTCHCNQRCGSYYCTFSLAAVYCGW